MLTVLLGGARSGKSSFAVRAGQRHPGGVTYIATSPHIAGDADLDDRIAAHQAERPATWRTIESELDLAAALSISDEDLVIVDCLTLWLNNLLHHGIDESGIANAALAAIAAASARTGDTIVITNEVGLGIVPDNELARRYRDTLGRMNQQWVAVSDRAYLLVAGRALLLSDVLPDAEGDPT